MRVEDFATAGLSKLTPAELEKLDALVRQFSAVKMTETTVAKRVDDPLAPARPEKAGKEATGLLARAKVILAPGTEVEYSTVESRLVGEFQGWDARTTFVLENGQRWRVVGGDSYVGPPRPSPVVKITPGVLGTFWMSFEGVNRKVKVTLVTAR